MQELGNAINESLSNSDRIAAGIEAIRRAGYDVFLVLEATIAFSKRDDDEPPSAPPEPPPPGPNSGKIRVTGQDAKFLRALKIQVDPEDQK